MDKTNYQLSGIQEEARQILHKLQSTNVPVDGLEYFTVGDKFRTDLIALKDEIIEIGNEPQPLEKIIVGGFGTGKTHFIGYLHWLMNKEGGNDTIISHIDLSELRDPHEFQFLAVTGMKILRGKGNFAQVLRIAYERVRAKYMRAYGNLSQSQIESFYAAILYSILGRVTNGWVNQDLLALLDVKDPVDQIINWLSGKTIQAVFQQIQSQSNQEHQAFVSTYLQLIRNPDAPISAFETPARALSFRNQLTDVIFRILRMADFKTIIITVDELESLKRFEPATTRQVLTSIRDFRDALGKIGGQYGYPSIAFICASTESFFADMLRTEEPALYSRWEDRDKHIILEPLSPVDIDNLIFKLRELHHLAGYKLRSVQWSEDDPDHEIIQIRKQIRQAHKDEPQHWTTRRLVTQLLKDIKTVWGN